MRRIAIIGAGQSGLQLGLGLLRQGYAVTLYSNRKPEEFANSKPFSSQCMFDAALQHERDIGLNLWEKECPTVDGISFTLAAPQGQKAFQWSARLDRYAQSVDQRLKMPVWMDLFSKKGGNLVYEDAGIETLEELARSHDLVIVASGKGEIGRLFEVDGSKSEFTKPMRALALTYVKGLAPRPEYSAVAFNAAPGVGEYFVFPALTMAGACEIMVFEGVPGGPMDCWGGVTSPEQHLEQSVKILRDWFPWEGERAGNVELTDPNGILAGRFVPAVKKPVATLPSGALIFGVADTVVLNDPITGQGSNNASKCAAVYLKSIIEREQKAFDPEWMQQTFDRYWDYARHVVNWTNRMLEPHAPHVVDILGAASQNPDLASRIANAFNDPGTVNPWWYDEDAARAVVAA